LAKVEEIGEWSSIDKTSSLGHETKNKREEFVLRSIIPDNIGLLKLLQ